jgi:hypothetical protein
MAERDDGTQTEGTSIQTVAADSYPEAPVVEGFSDSALFDTDPIMLDLYEDIHAELVEHTDVLGLILSQLSVTDTRLQKNHDRDRRDRQRTKSVEPTVIESVRTAPQPAPKATESRPRPQTITGNLPPMEISQETPSQATPNTPPRPRITENVPAPVRDSVDEALVEADRTTDAADTNVVVVSSGESEKQTPSMVAESREVEKAEKEVAQPTEAKPVAKEEQQQERQQRQQRQQQRTQKARQSRLERKRDEQVDLAQQTNEETAQGITESNAIGQKLIDRVKRLQLSQDADGKDRRRDFVGQLVLGPFYDAGKELHDLVGDLRVKAGGEDSKEEKKNAPQKRNEEVKKGVATAQQTQKRDAQGRYLRKQEMGKQDDQIEELEGIREELEDKEKADAKRHKKLIKAVRDSGYGLFDALTTRMLSGGFPSMSRGGGTSPSLSRGGAGTGAGAGTGGAGAGTGGAGAGATKGGGAPSGVVPTGGEKKSGTTKADRTTGSTSQEQSSSSRKSSPTPTPTPTEAKPEKKTGQEVAKERKAEKVQAESKKPPKPTPAEIAQQRRSLESRASGTVPPPATNTTPAQKTLPPRDPKTGRFMSQAQAEALQKNTPKTSKDFVNQTLGPKGAAPKGRAGGANPLGMIITAGIAAAGAYNGAQEAERIFDVPTEAEASKSQTFSAGFAGAVEALSFGILTKDTVAKKTQGFLEWADTNFENPVQTLGPLLGPMGIPFMRSGVGDQVLKGEKGEDENELSLLEQTKATLAEAQEKTTEAIQGTWADFKTGVQGIVDSSLNLIGIATEETIQQSVSGLQQTAHNLNESNLAATAAATAATAATGGTITNTLNYSVIDNARRLGVALDESTGKVGETSKVVSAEVNTNLLIGKDTVLTAANTTQEVLTLSQNTLRERQGEMNDKANALHTSALVSLDQVQLATKQTTQATTDANKSVYDTQITLNSLWTSLSTKTSEIVQGVKTKLDEYKLAITGSLASLSTQFSSFTDSVGTWVTEQKEWLKQKTSGLIEGTVSTAESVGEVVVETTDVVIDQGVKVVEGIADHSKEAIKETKGYFKNLWDDLFSDTENEKPETETSRTQELERNVRNANERLESQTAETQERIQRTLERRQQQQSQIEQANQRKKFGQEDPNPEPQLYHSDEVLFLMQTGRL